MADVDGLWDFSDPALSESRFREALAGESLGDGALVLRTQIARALGLQHCFDEAHAELDGIEEEVASASDEVRVRLALERGRVHNSSGSAGAAIPFFLDAVQLAIGANLDALAVDAAHMLGIAEPGEAGERWTRRAIELSEDSADPKARRWRGSLLNNLGWSRFGAGDSVGALECFEGALDARIEAGVPEPVRVARWCVARAMRELGRIEEALEIQTALESEYREAGESSGYVQEELGECLLLLGRDADAPAYFREAYRELSGDAWLAEREPERLERLKRLGEGSA